MSLFRKLLTTKCQSVEPGPDFGQASAASDLSEPLTREKREPTEAELANPSALVKVWIEPASAHTKSQSLLLTRTEIEADESIHYWASRVWVRSLRLHEVRLSNS